MALQQTQTFNTSPQQDINALLGTVKVRTPEELQAAAEALYGPYFAQQLQDLTDQYNLDTGRNTEDQQLQGQIDAFGNQIASDQAIGNYNDRFGDVFGSPLQQKLEANRLQQINLNQLGQQRQFQRRQYDIGEILRKGKLQNTYGKQQAVGEYVAGNQFLGL